jgi:hypothetical protein
MILHIMRKDWKLLWPLVIGVALIGWIERIANSSRGIFPERLAPLAVMSTYLGMVSLLAAGILIVLWSRQTQFPDFVRTGWCVRSGAKICC